jgi:hypothetical protein
MKRLTHRKNRIDEAMLLKTEVMMRLTFHRLGFSLHRFIAVNTI